MVCIINGIFHGIFRCVCEEKRQYHEWLVDVIMVSAVGV